MELCSLEDAFPTIKTDSLRGTPPGCKDTTATKEERKAARKKAKKCKGPPLSYLEATEETDPDRPAMKRMDAVPTVTEQNEEFAMPVLPKASCTFSDPGYPSYFGKGIDDTEEGFSSFTNVIGDDPNYRLESDATKSFELKGVAMPGGSPTLPVPSVNNVWKPMTPTGSYTAFVSSLPLPGGMMPKRRNDTVYRQEQEDNDELPGPTAAEDSETSTRDVLIKRIEELQGRLDQLEATKRKNSQTEILIFVGTGIFVLASLHMITGRRR